MKKILFLLTFVVYCAFGPIIVNSLSYSDIYKSGRIYMERQEFEKAVSLLSSIENEYSLLKDYLLFDIAKCYESIGDVDNAGIYYEEIIEKHKDSIIFRKAFRSLVLMSTKNYSKEDEAYLSGLLSDYLSIYPDDSEILIEKALFLEKLGSFEESKKILKKVFVSGLEFSSKAYDLIKIRNIKLASEEIEKAVSNFLTKNKNKFALEVLQENKNTTPKLKYLLGKAYFNLKKYQSAASIFKDLDIENSRKYYALSLLRCGERKSFYEVMADFSLSNIKTNYELFYAYAESKRREGLADEAEKIFKSMLEFDTKNIESTKWGLAWLAIRTRDFSKARHILLELIDLNSSDKTKYIFWLNKISVYAGNFVDNHKINLDGKDYYSLKMINFSNLYTEPFFNHTSFNGNNMIIDKKLLLKFMRVKELAYIGMKEYAKKEIKGLLTCIKKEDVLKFATLFENVEDFNSISKLGFLHKDYEYLKYPFAYKKNIENFSNYYSVSPELLWAIMKEESAFNPKIVSSAGAVGLMQLMPSTAKKFYKLRKNDELYDPELNIKIASNYISKLLKEFKNTVYTIASYNAGEHKVREWIKENKYLDEDEFIEDIPYKETKDYVKKVLKSMHIYKKLYNT